jgi:PhoH-like ATPase
MKKDEQFIEEWADDETIDQIYASKSDLNNLLQIDLNVGQYLTIQSETNHNKKAVLFKTGGKIHLMKNNSHRKGVNPKDLHQNLFQQLLEDDAVKILVCSGQAGSGKTYLSLAWATDLVLKRKDLKLIMSKPLYQIGKSRAIGTLPGDMNEKMAPFLDSFGMALNKLLPSKEFIQSCFEKELLEYKAIEMLRGCSFENTIFVVDEVQNLDYNELKSLISRMGEGTKLILLGDPTQIDRDHTWKQSGLYQLMETDSFKKSELCGKIHLVKCFRGPISEFMNNVDNEIKAKLNTPLTMYNLSTNNVYDTY